MFNYDKSAQTAKTLLSRFGRIVTHRRINAGTYNPSTDTFTGASTINTSVNACDFAVNGQDLINNSLIQEGDRYALIEPTLSDIQTNDLLIIDGVTWTILRVDTLAPAGIKVLFKVYIRK